jgi:hypothetical protein
MVVFGNVIFKILNFLKRNYCFDVDVKNNL